MRLGLSAIVTLLLTLLTVQGSAGELPVPTGPSIVSPNARLKLLFTRMANIKGGLTEGAAVAPDGSIYFSDIPFGSDKGMILRFDPKTKRTTVFSSDSGKSNGLIFDSHGFLLACEGANFGGRRVSRWNIKTGKRTTIVDNYHGRKFNAPNDLCVDRRGRIFFTDPRYIGDEPRELKHRAVYRIDPGGSVAEVTHKIVKPNGIALSPDDRTLYVADHDNGTDKIVPGAPEPEQGIMKIYAFPLGRDGAVHGPRKTIVDFGRLKGCDGMTVDRAGRLYLAIRAAERPGVMVITPAGKEVAFIPTGPKNQTVDVKHPPVGLPSNVEFGIGRERNMLYITVDQSLYRIHLKVDGLHVQYGNKRE